MKSRSSEVSRRLAVVAAWPAPFRIHLNRRFAQAIAPMELVSPFYRAMPGTDCSNPDLQQIGTSCFNWYEERCSRGRIGRLIYDCRVAGRIWQKLKEDRVDAVIIAGWDSLVQLCLIRDLSAAGIPFFMQGDSNVLLDNQISRARRLVKSLLLRWVFRRAAGVLPVGTQGRKYFEGYGVSPGRMFTVPIEPDYERFVRVDPAEVRSFCDRHGMAMDRRRLLFAGRLVEVKSPQQLFDAFIRLAAERPEWDLVVAGQGPLDPRRGARSEPQRIAHAEVGYQCHSYSSWWGLERVAGTAGSLAQDQRGH